jgi:predicted transposase/invertase (TIGR01784 family)
MHANKKVERNYKNNMFIDYIGTKEKLIEVYNAVSGKNYSPDTEIEINTLTNILFRHMLNDISFVIDGKLIVLIEHQSTINENMPVRMLEYMTSLSIGNINKDSLYQKKLIKIPRPEFIVFYNGKEKYKERETLRLSDAYMDGGGRIMLELEVDVYNINLGMNKELLEKSKALREYSIFNEKVHEYQREGDKLEKAMKKAKQYCLKYGIMDVYLEKIGGEGMSFLYTEYNYEDELRVTRDEGIAEGLAKGEKKGLSKGLSLGEKKGRAEGLSLGREEERFASAKRMKVDGVEPAFIAKYTGLPLDEIERL